MLISHPIIEREIELLPSRYDSALSGDLTYVMANLDLTGIRSVLVREVQPPVAPSEHFKPTGRWFVVGVAETETEIYRAWSLEWPPIIAFDPPKSQRARGGQS